VDVVAAPTRAEPGDPTPVCFRVEGTGHLPHVAVHWDTASHPNATTFADYKGGAVYPGGAAVASPAGYDLPGTFCTTIPPQTQTIYYRAHALDPTHAPGTLSPERVLYLGPPPSLLDPQGDVPQIAAAGSNVTVCWLDDVVGHIPHTALHWDTTSHPNSTSFTDYKGGAVYPDNQSAAAASGYDTPGPFCTNLVMPPSGVLYFRAHEFDPATGLNNLSQEYSIVVGPSVSVVSAPASAPAGSKTLVCWRVEPEGAATHVPHTAVHWDTTSHPDSTSFTDYKGGAVYPDNGTAAAASGYDLPGPWCTDLTMPASGTLYFRAHVLLPGVRNEMSDEVAIAAT
jgi:uncharacterized protein (DUF427 family)